MPNALAQRTLLHLTDLHFGSPASGGHYWNSDLNETQLAEHDRRGLLRSLLDDLHDQQLQPDLVLVTGDLLDRGAQDGVPLACDFLAALATGLGLPRSRIVLAPGNHDVLRVSDPAERYRYFDAIRDGFYGALRASLPPGTPPYHRVEHFEFASELGIEVVAFNSCEALAPPAQEHGSVGQAQRDRANALLAATEGKGLFRIAMMHHHLDRPSGVVRDDLSVMDDAGLIRDWLARHRFQLALHGHQHVDWEEIRLINNWFLSISAGASAGVASYGRAAWQLPLGYQVIVIDTPENGRRIRREYSVQMRRWVAAGREASEKRLRFGLDLPTSQTQTHGGGKTPSAKKRPKIASLQKLLKDVLRIDAHLNTFCVTYFPDVAAEFSSGMLRADKLNLLLQLQKPADILDKLREYRPEEFHENEGLIEYE